jgi:hypothetical protein
MIMMETPPRRASRKLASRTSSPASVLEGVRDFTIKARGQSALAASSAPPFPGDEVQRAVGAAMAGYVERAKQIAALQEDPTPTP